MMDKRYQVFISSTYEDLKEERAEVIQALLELDCIPAGMEMFPAANEDQWTLIKKVIDECDYYLLIIGGRYGSENKDGISYTQMEYEYAQSIGKPTIAFLPKNPDSIPQGKTDKSSKKLKKLNDFKALVQKKLVKFWETPTDLGSVVSRSMIKLIKDYPAEGWVRANSAVDETSVKEIAKLQKENSELKSKLESISTVAPAGSDDLAQGDDIFQINFGFTGQKKNDYSKYKCSSFIGVTWNDIFVCVSPNMINECNDLVFRTSLNMLLKSYENEILDNDVFKNIVSASDFKIDKESFDKIKVQLKALGLICLSEKKRTASDNSTYWKLTKYGDYIMTKLMAIEK